MRDWAAHLLRSRTGQDVGAWNRRVAEAGLPDEQALRAWLDGQGVTGYGQALLVWERFGYPDFLTAEADELIAGQYADRPQLRPVLDAVLAALPAVGPANGTGPQDDRQPGHAAPYLRGDPGDDQEPGGPGPAAGASSAPAAGCSPRGISARPPCGSR